MQSTLQYASKEIVGQYLLIPRKYCAFHATLSTGGAACDVGLPVGFAAVRDARPWLVGINYASKLNKESL